LLGGLCGSLTDEVELIAGYLSGKGIASEVPGLTGVIGNHHEDREKGLVRSHDRLADERRKHCSVVEVEALVNSLPQQQVDDLGAGFAHFLGNPGNFQRYRLFNPGGDYPREFRGPSHRAVFQVGGRARPCNCHLLEAYRVVIAIKPNLGCWDVPAEGFNRPL
jgi:hypothetical protein